MASSIVHIFHLATVDEYSLWWSGLSPIHPDKSCPLGSSELTGAKGNERTQDNYWFAYQHLMADTPNIAFSKDELDANYLTFWKSSNIALDVYLTEFLTDKVRILLFQINSQISQYSKTEYEAVRRIVNDVLIFTTAFPVQVTERPTHHDAYYPFQMEIFRRTIQVLSPKIARKVLRAILRSMDSYERNFRYTRNAILQPLAYSVSPENQPYHSLTLLQRMIWLSLTGLHSMTAEQVTRDELFRAVLRLPNDQLLKWMLACADSDEQNYLNSCEVAAANHGMVNHTTVLPVLLIFLTKISTSLRETFLPFASSTSKAYFCLWPFTAPSLQHYLRQTLDNVDRITQRIRTEAFTQIERGKNGKEVSVESLHSLVAQWNFAMQTLSCVYSPHKPAILTAKLFSEKWLLSCRLITPICLFASIIPKQPWFFERKRGIHALFHEFPRYARWSIYTHDEQLNRFAERFHELVNQREALLDRLWLCVLDNGGMMLESHETLYFSRIPHLMFLIAAKSARDQKRVLADPEVKAFKLLSYDDMTAFVLEKDLEWEVMLDS